jgi:hypothetical protein
LFGLFGEFDMLLLPLVLFCRSALAVLDVFSFCKDTYTPVSNDDVVRFPKNPGLECGFAIRVRTDTTLHYQWSWTNDEHFGWLWLDQNTKHFKKFTTYKISTFSCLGGKVCKPNVKHQLKLTLGDPPSREIIIEYCIGRCRINKIPQS